MVYPRERILVQLFRKFMCKWYIISSANDIGYSKNY